MQHCIMSLHSNIWCTVFFPCTCAAHGLKLESVLVRWSVHVGSQPGGEAQKTAVSTQHTVPHSAVFMSHRHVRVEQRLCLCARLCCQLFLWLRPSSSVLILHLIKLLNLRLYFRAHWFIIDEIPVCDACFHCVLVLHWLSWGVCNYKSNNLYM